MQAYPVTNREKCCAMYKRKMEYKREELRKRLINECERQEKISTGLRISKQEIY